MVGTALKSARHWLRKRICPRVSRVRASQPLQPRPTNHWDREMDRRVIETTKLLFPMQLLGVLQLSRVGECMGALISMAKMSGTEQKPQVVFTVSATRVCVELETLPVSKDGTTYEQNTGSIKTFIMIRSKPHLFAYAVKDPCTGHLMCFCFRTPKGKGKQTADVTGERLFHALMCACNCWAAMTDEERASHMQLEREMGCPKVSFSLDSTTSCSTTSTAAASRMSTSTASLEEGDVDVAFGARDLDKVPRRNEPESSSTMLL